ncbi:MAG: PA0069 family radical SAM protein [Candidatus Omnitrophica bacterium]|nr:PA0069 family radical SAM protein [Candidatus Omnitrophota bacterium]
MKPITNPPNPFQQKNIQYFEGVVPPAKLEIYLDNTKTILSENDSPDLAFRWSINPYRGCQHACAYCFARPGHEYLDFGAGTDFDTKILVKEKAPELLREAFMKKSWKGEPIFFSGNTDCYQPLEACYEITRGLLEVCLEFGNPVSIVTKSFLILRDLEILKALNQRTHLSVFMSIPFLNEKKSRLMEPGAASVPKRFEALDKLSQAGIPCGVLIAPIIPGLNDSDFGGIMKEASHCGARWAEPIMLRLPGSVKEVFIERLKTHFPGEAEKIIGRIRQVRGGKLYDSRFGERYKGQGPYWDNLQQMFQVFAQKYGFNQPYPEPKRLPFKRPTLQSELF